MISRKNQFLEVLLYCGATTAILWAIYFSLATIRIPYQIEYREGASLVMTDFLLKGENPFAFDSQPLAMNNYGFVYSMVVYPFAAFLGNTLATHRVVTFIFIGLSGILGFVTVYEKTQSSSLALACTAFIMIGLIAYGGIGAFPSSLGTFLFLLALLFPLLKSFNRSSIVLSFLISLAAFYTKPYFLLSSAIVSSYLFFFVSKKKGLLFGILFLIVFLLSLVVIGRLFPLYFINIFIGNVSNANMIFGHLLDQLKILFLSFYPVLLFALAMLIFSFFKGRTRFKIDGSLVNVSKWERPFLSLSFNFLFYSFVCSLFVFVLVLGPHKGNYLNYAFQLLVPTFFCWFFVKIPFWNESKLFFIFIVLINLFSWERDVLNPVMLKQKDSKE
ncbi:MAG: hypothetical protein JNM55_21890 [Anaerolineales bacterium]|nr:hypothetical protein [Anaerolineales bacterium]